MRSIEQHTSRAGQGLAPSERADRAERVLRVIAYLISAESLSPSTVARTYHALRQRHQLELHSPPDLFNLLAQALSIDEASIARLEFVSGHPLSLLRTGRRRR